MTVNKCSFTPTFLRFLSQRCGLERLIFRVQPSFGADMMTVKYRGGSEKQFQSFTPKEYGGCNFILSRISSWNLNILPQMQCDIFKAGSTQIWWENGEY